jgi:hypothetical protein
MRNRVIFLIALAIAVALVPHVYSMVEAVIGLFPIEEGDIVTVDLDAVLWLRAAFIAAHACVAWFVVLIWRRKGTLALNILTLILLTELITIYVATLRFWYGGIPEIRLY